MKEPILGRPVPRPIEDLKDLVRGKLGGDPKCAPMENDVETVIQPSRPKSPRRPGPGAR